MPNTTTVFDSIGNFTEYYRDEPEIHREIWSTLQDFVDQTPLLKKHREWVLTNGWGYGETQFHWMWNLLIREAPRDFKCLEIGVFKGQIISLCSLLNREYSKGGYIYGVTPMSMSGDKYSKHPDEDYEYCIQVIYAAHELDASDLTIFHGLSNDLSIVENVRAEGPYHIIYVDGCHDYDVVMSDILTYKEFLLPGGYMVIDDSSSNLKIPDGIIRMNWRGLPDVTRAVEETLEVDPEFTHLFAVGHNRVFQKRVN